MKKKLTNNLLLKVVSVLIAILIWVIVANVNDPIVSETYDVPVTIINGAYIESIGKTYRVLEEGQKVKVTLKGKSSVVKNRQSDIEAVADLTQIVDMDAEPYVMVPVIENIAGAQADSVTVAPQTIKIVLEEMASQEFIIGFDIMNAPESKYRVGEVTATPEKVKIMGPASVIQKIDHVIAKVDVAGKTEDTKNSSDLIIYDKNQEVLTHTTMSSLKFDIGEPTVDVNVDLWRVVPEVGITVNYSGNPRTGYQVSELSSTPSQISIAGTEEAIALLKENDNTIVIPASEVDINGAASDVETKVDLAQFLPEGTKMASDISTVIVTVSILPLGSEQFEILTKDIEISGLSDRYTVTYETDEVIARVRGEEQLLAAINESVMKPRIDLNGQTIGTHKVLVELTLPGDSELLEDVMVAVEIKELE